MNRGSSDDEGRNVRTKSGIACAVGLLLLAACGGGKGASNGEVERPAQAVPPIIAPLATPYRVASAGATGSIAGTVSIEGAAPPPRVIPVTADPEVCGDRVADESFTPDGRLENAVVWLEGVTAGKARSVLRRFEITQDRCMLEPRVQAVEAGGTLNVRSQDPIVHRTRFITQPAGSLLALISEVDAGQVVPDERILAKAGLVEVRCDQHPFTRGWIAVFDHPYYAVTASDGSFVIDDIPPGTYTLVAWHERGRRTTRQLTIAAGQRLGTSLSMRLE